MESFGRREQTHNDLTDFSPLKKQEALSNISQLYYRRNVFWGTLFQNFEGMRDVTDPDPAMFRSFVAGFVKGGKLRPGTLLVCQDKLRHSGKSDYVKELRYLQQVVPRDLWGGIKITLPSPNWYHLQFREGYAYPKDMYRDDQEYFRDMAAAYRTELDLLYEAGLRNVQFDDPNLTCMLTFGNMNLSIGPDDLSSRLYFFWETCMLTLCSLLRRGYTARLGNR